MIDRENSLWVEKYRPTKVADCILPVKTKKFFQTIVDQKDVPMLLLNGSAGTGKTTAALAMCAEIGADVMFINASEENGIDTIRNKIKQFASTVSFSGGLKVVILDEADYLHPQSAQPALRSFMEQFSDNCRFILTCNFKNRIIDPLHSRCTVVDFAISKDERRELMEKLFARVAYILKEENVKFDPAVVAEVIKRHFPDARKVLNELQRYARSGDGTIDSGILVKQNDIGITGLLASMKSRKFGEVRQWVNDHIDAEPEFIFRTVYENLAGALEPKSVPSAVIILADYQYKQAFVADTEINILACLTEIMSNCDFK